MATDAVQPEAVKVTAPIKSTWGSEYNRWWKTQQKPAIEPRQAPITADKTPVIHPSTPQAPVIIEIDPAFILVQGGLPAPRRFKLTKPIVIRKMGENYMLIDGKRRLAAAIAMKMKKIRAEVQD